MSKFEINVQPDDFPDRVHVKVDGTFDVAIIRTPEGIVLDVYPAGWDNPIDTMTVWDEDVVAAEGEDLVNQKTTTNRAAAQKER